MAADKDTKVQAVFEVKNSNEVLKMRTCSKAWAFTMLYTPSSARFIGWERVKNG